MAYEQEQSQPIGGRSLQGFLSALSLGRDWANDMKNNSLDKLYYEGMQKASFANKADEAFKEEIRASLDKLKTNQPNPLGMADYYKQFEQGRTNDRDMFINLINQRDQQWAKLFEEKFKQDNANKPVMETPTSGASGIPMLYVDDPNDTLLKNRFPNTYSPYVKTAEQIRASEQNLLSGWNPMDSLNKLWKAVSNDEYSDPKTAYKRMQDRNYGGIQATITTR